jgi:nucleoside-diphosphate-sugar epimerase
MDLSTAFAGNSILVTGATGFIGSALCRQLSSYGVDLHGISRQSSPDNGLPVRWWTGDLSDYDRVQAVMGEVKPDVLFHLGSHVAGSREIDLVFPTFQSNLQSTVNLLTAAVRVGCRRVVLAGSMEEPEDSDGAAVPCSPYAAAKWASNAYARMFRELYGLSVTTARIFMVYGPGQMDLKKLIPYVTLSLLRKNAPQLTSGHRQIDWIYVDDVVKGLVAMAATERITSDRIDLGSGKLASIQTIVEKLVDIIDASITPQFGSVPDRPLEQSRVARVAESTGIIGWKPAISLEEGLSQTVAWYRRQLERNRL